MRLPLIPPAELSPEQKSLYDEMRKGIASNFNAFKVERDDGALMGPWNPWLHEPEIGKAIWNLTLAMTANASLPDNVRQVLSWSSEPGSMPPTRSHAHIAVAEQEGMKPERLASLVADLKPNDLAPDESVAPMSPTSWCGAVPCPSRFTDWRSTPSRSARNQRADLSGGPLQPRIHDPQRLQRTGAGAQQADWGLVDRSPSRILILRDPKHRSCLAAGEFLEDRAPVRYAGGLRPIQLAALVSKIYLRSVSMSIVSISS